MQCRSSESAKKIPLNCISNILFQVPENEIYFIQLSIQYLVKALNQQHICFPEHEYLGFNEHIAQQTEDF